MNKYGICTSSSSKYTILDEIGNHFLDHAIELVKAGKKFVLVCDNIDWEERVHDMRSDHQNKSVHAVATTLVFDRVKSDYLPDNGSQQQLQNTDLNRLVEMSGEDLECLRLRYRVFIVRHLKEHFKCFNKIDKLLPEKTYCSHREDMSKKSDVITMPILMKDEKKYSDCVSILDTFEDWVHKIYSAADRCTTTSITNDESSPSVADLIPEGSNARPDQPASHIPPQAAENDPLLGVQIPCYGDQLTRVRLAGAKDLRAGCHSPRQRIDHIYPYRIVDWHSKRSFLKVSI